MEDRTISYDEFNAGPAALLPERRQWIIAPIIFGVLTFLMFMDVLFTSTKVVSNLNTDLALQFLPWRDFGFTEIAKGNFPLWNPHVFGGAPYFAGFQSALLYPPNWLHLILPLGVAINWIVALHVFLLGYFVYFWCRGNGVGIGGSIVAGVMYMFCGPYFLHLYAGHLPHLAVMVWTPLMLLSLDMLDSTARWKWLLLGITATAMHILSGHPQYVYYTGMILAIYTALKLFVAEHRPRLVVGFLAMYIGAVLLTAVQLFAGLEAAGESVRNVGLNITRAGTFSLPPENLLTLIAPNFFSKLPLVPAKSTEELSYWGAGYLWEMSLFVSVTGLILAFLGTFRIGQEVGVKSQSLSILRHFRDRPQIVISVVMILVTFILALGRHTPLYNLMYNHLPGYNGFRGTVKFASLMMLFVSLLAAWGFDGLTRNRKVSWWIVGTIGVGALVVFIFGGIISASGSSGTGGSWARFVNDVMTSAKAAEENFAEGFLQHLANPKFITMTAEPAAAAMFLAGATILLVGTLLALSRLNGLVPYALVLLVMVEMFTFARMTRATMDPAGARVMPKSWAQAIEQLRHINKDIRVATADFALANQGLNTDAPFNNLNGYDPGVLRNYAEVITYSQGGDRRNADQYLPFRALSNTNKPFFRALRCVLILHPQGTGQIDRPLPVVSLYGSWARLVGDDDVLAVMFVPQGQLQPPWDPDQIVLIQGVSNVPLTPSTDPAGSVRVIGESTDHLEIEADVIQPAMMLVTNNYSKGWRVVPKIPTPTGQDKYVLLRANYTQIGIPLAAGKHHFILEYSPVSFRVGRWVSLLSLLGLTGWGILLMNPTRWFR